MGNASHLETAAVRTPHVETLNFGRNATEICIPPGLDPRDARYHASVLSLSAAELVKCVGERTDSDSDPESEEIRYALAGIEALIRLSLIFQNYAAIPGVRP